jgi:hypothetical protein
MTSACIGCGEPVEAQVRIVGALLLREKQGKAMLVRGARPAGTAIVTARGLGAAVQDHDQRGTGVQLRRHVGAGDQVTRVRPESGEWLKARIRRIGQRMGDPAFQSAQAADCVVKAGDDHSPAPMSAQAITPQERFCCTAA